MTFMDWINLVSAIVLFLAGQGLVGKLLLQRTDEKVQTRLRQAEEKFEGEIRRLQAALDRTVLVHRVQFETEFAALRAIWAKVAATRSTMMMVRPMLDFRPAEETPADQEARELDRLNKFGNAYNAMKDVVNENSPFIPEDIHGQLTSLIDIAFKEAAEVQTERPTRDRNPERDWHKRGREHLHEFIDASTALSSLIRARLAKLTILEGGR